MPSQLKHPSTRLLILFLLLAVAAPAHAESPEAGEKPARAPTPSSKLSGHEIYKRFLNNKYRSGIQELKITSTDPGGSEQATRLTAALQDNRDENDQAVEGILANLMVRISSPFDMRHTAYLMIAKDPGPDDEFIYTPSERIVKRVDLKKTPLLGTDYTFDDLAYHDVSSATYTRLSDEKIAGVPVFVVEANIKDTKRVHYHRTVSYIEQEHFVPLRVRYWDEFEIEIKEMTADAATLTNFGGNTWGTRESKMTDLLQGTSSSIEVIKLDTDPTFAPRYFSVRRLAQGK